MSLPDRRASFLARLQYAVEPPEKVNHPPRVVLNDDDTVQILKLGVPPGQECLLDAAGTSDPDGDELTYRWWLYKEAGTYAGAVLLSGDRSQMARVVVPADVGDRTLHVIVEVRDNGSPGLVAYRRAILSRSQTRR